MGEIKKETQQVVIVVRLLSLLIYSNAQGQQQLEAE